jgi:hypothetical protein
LFGGLNFGLKVNRDLVASATFPNKLAVGGLAAGALNFSRLFVSGNGEAGSVILATAVAFEFCTGLGKLEQIGSWISALRLELCFAGSARGRAGFDPKLGLIPGKARSESKPVRADMLAAGEELLPRLKGKVGSF